MCSSEQREVQRVESNCVTLRKTLRARAVARLSPVE
jgi:hypothetical protein